LQHFFFYNLRTLGNIGRERKVLAILAYTVLSKEKDSVEEKGILDFIENTLNNAELTL
jgi:hypothetical protein